MIRDIKSMIGKGLSINVCQYNYPLVSKWLIKWFIGA